MRPLLLAATLLAGLALAGPAQAGHGLIPIPDGTMTFFAPGGTEVVTFAPVPVGDLDQYYFWLCDGTQALPTGSGMDLPAGLGSSAVYCTYDGKYCPGSLVPAMCDLYSPVPLPAPPPL